MASLLRGNCPIALLPSSSPAPLPSLPSSRERGLLSMHIRCRAERGNSRQSAQQQVGSDWGTILVEKSAKACVVALAAVSLCFVDPALAFKSILRQVNFKGAKLVGASFFDADLTGADLSDADLRGADFSLTNAAKANFTNANLEGALVTGNTSFKGAKITGADFTDVLFRDDQRELLCKIADGVNPVTGNNTKETLACR